MLASLAAGIVALAGLYLVVLGVTALVAPQRAGRFLLAHAGTPALHYLEMALRLAVGAALVVHAPRMAASQVFLVVGGIVLATTACLLLVPWRWHRRIAERTVPQALRFITVLGLCSLALGGFVLLAILRPGSGLGD